MKFKLYMANHPCKDITWNLFLEVLQCEYAEHDVVEVTDREVPFDDQDGIYAQNGGPKLLCPVAWLVELLLVCHDVTTEAVPTRIIETIDRESANQGELQDDRFKVYDFGLPDSARDTVTIELQRACKKESLDQLVRAYHEEYPHAEMIADMVKNRISEFLVITHMSAKGSNSYIGGGHTFVYNALSPVLFGELGALNTRFGRSDLVRLFYTDRFDQTCGRNRGFRGEEGRGHRAVFPPRLHNWLAPAMSTASYVGVQAKPSVTLNVTLTSQIETG